MSRSGKLPQLLNGADPGLDAPDVLRMQPLPKAVSVAHQPMPGGFVTSIMRVWDEKDVGRCRLCPECGVNRFNACLVVVPRHVPYPDCVLYEIGKPTPLPIPRPRTDGKGWRR